MAHHCAQTISGSLRLSISNIKMLLYLFALAFAVLYWAEIIIIPNIVCYQYSTDLNNIPIFLML